MSLIAREEPLVTSRLRLSPWWRRADWDALSVAAVALLPGALTAYFAFSDGGYYAGSAGLVAVELALLLVLRLVLARVPWEGGGPALLAATVALGFLAAWALASQSWSNAPIRAITEHDRALVYLLTLVFFGSL